MNNAGGELSWGQTAWRLASEFDQGLGARAEEIVTFEGPNRAIAVGITRPNRDPLLANANRAPAGAVRLRGRFGGAARGRKSAAAFAPGLRSGFRELARIRRVIVIGQMRCVNLVQVVRGASNQVYALHGVSSELAASALRADMDAVISGLQP